jgi:hypothetical protein
MPRYVREHGHLALDSGSGPMTSLVRQHVGMGVVDRIS